MTKEEVLKMELSKLITAVAAYNEAVASNDAQRIASAKGDVDKALEDCNKQIMLNVFADCKKAENPVLAAIKTYSYNIMGVKIDKDTNLMEMTSDKSRQIDLLKFFRWCNMSHLWEYKVAKMNQLMCLRVCKELGMTPEEISRVKGLYYLKEAAKAEEMGAVPTSNSQIVKLLQMTIDAILFIDDGKGHNKIRAISRDASYLAMVYAKRSNKNKHCVTVARDNFMTTLIMDVMNRIVTNGVYGVDGYKPVKADKPTKTTAAEPDPETEKPESETNGAENSEPKTNGAEA